MYILLNVVTLGKAIHSMEIVDFRKETSERSERQNWVLDELSASTIFYFSGFEGCNEDSSDVVTAIMDRASISITGDPLILPDIETVIHAIEGIEGKTLRGKIMRISFFVGFVP